MFNFITDAATRTAVAGVEHGVNRPLCVYPLSPKLITELYLETFHHNIG